MNTYGRPPSIDSDTPTPFEINDHPELAILAALAHTTQLATHALFAAHPALWAEVADVEEHAADDVVAMQVVRIAVLLGETIDAYRDVVLRRRR